MAVGCLQSFVFLPILRIPACTCPVSLHRVSASCWVCCILPCPVCPLAYFGTTLIAGAGPGPALQAPGLLCGAGPALPRMGPSSPSARHLDMSASACVPLPLIALPPRTPLPPPHSLIRPPGSPGVPYVLKRPSPAGMNRCAWFPCPHCLVQDLSTTLDASGLGHGIKPRRGSGWY